jgi:transposase
MILFFDEGRFGLQPQVARLWALKGDCPQADIKPGYQNFYLYAAVDPQCGEAFILELPWVNTDMMNLYLQHLAAAFPTKKILLIWDQAGYHCSKELHVPKNIKVEPLPPYSPQLNPTERLWRWLRRHACRNRLFDSFKDLQKALTDEINKLSMNQIASICSCEYMSINN